MSTAKSTAVVDIEIAQNIPLPTIEEHSDTESVGRAECPHSDSGTVAPRTSPERGGADESSAMPTWPEDDWASSYVGRSLQEELEQAGETDDSYSTGHEDLPANEDDDVPVIDVQVQQLRMEPPFNWEMAVLLAMVFAAFPWRAFFSMVVAILSWRGLMAWLGRFD